MPLAMKRQEVGPVDPEASGSRGSANASLLFPRWTFSGLRQPSAAYIFGRKPGRRGSDMFASNVKVEGSTIATHVNSQFGAASSNARSEDRQFRQRDAYLEVKQRFMWSDSKTVLSWIHSNHRRYKQFVAFHIGEIHSLTKIAEWRWVPTKCNAADALTKWEKAHSMHFDALWFRGPGFLYQSEDCWPKQDSITPNVAEEVRACFQYHDITITDSRNHVDSRSATQRFSKWRVLVRTMSCVYRFASNCRRKKSEFKIETVPATEAVQKAVSKCVRSTTVPLKREEYRKPEAYLWRSAQANCFNDEIKTIKKNRQLPLQQQLQLEKSSSLHNLRPFLDAEDHPVTDKLLEYYHHKVTHRNVESAVKEIRQRFSIQNLRAELKRIGKSCMWCKVKKCRARTPRMAPLPESRVTPGLPPFSHTGVDFCGPVTVTVGRRSEKRYICLFTSMTTRTVHLEVSHSAVSDFKEDRPRSHAVKPALAVFDDGRSITDEVFLTAVAEAEDLFNSRPLTYVALKSKAQEALTPNHFIRGVGTINVERAVPNTSEGEALRDQYKRSQLLADKL
ncbi:uncharacterized protein LOC134210187 [Armigeres subalbatus]|uniref:uncharacterized protein LOC134210187 n=1 Tax=Armigeres subalbatus TaxID=124917 RepID=UPI002ED4A8BB